MWRCPSVMRRTPKFLSTKSNEASTSNTSREIQFALRLRGCRHDWYSDSHVQPAADRNKSVVVGFWGYRKSFGEGHAMD